MPRTMSLSLRVMPLAALLGVTACAPVVGVHAGVGRAYVEPIPYATVVPAPAYVAPPVYATPYRPYRHHYHHRHESRYDRYWREDGYRRGHWR